MILFHKYPEDFQALSCYPIHSCVQPHLWLQNCYPCPQPLLPQQHPQVQPALKPSDYAPSRNSKG